MIARLKLWSAAAGLVIAALLASWFGGRKSAKIDIKAKADLATARAIRQVEEIENEVEALSPDALERRAAKWVRNPTR